MFLGLTLVSCAGNGPTQKDMDNLSAKADSIQKVCDQQAKTIQSLRDSVSILAFPADQRLSKIKSLVASEDYSGARNQIAQLKSIFPNSAEVIACNTIEESIRTKEADKKAEEERIKALGFKAISQKNSFSVGYNTLTLSGFSVGSQFVYDAYDDSWFYNTADRGNKYVTAAMSIKSTNKNPNIPELAIYSISGDKMHFESKFTTKYARWRNYGTYLGNYHDTNNDFTKVSTVKFKIGAEVNESVITKAFAIVCKKENGLSSSYNRYDNPPMSWTGSVNYPSSLNVADFAGNYVLVKLFNLK